jgi:hypothetical protein
MNEQQSKTAEQRSDVIGEWMELDGSPVDQSLYYVYVCVCFFFQFWRELPSLVKDGVGFFVGKCRGLCGGGGASGGVSASNTTSYETM